MFRFATWNLGARITVSVLALGIAILGAVGLTSYVTARAALLDAAGAEARVLAERTALEAEKDFATLSRIPLAIAAGEQRPLDGATRKAQLERTLPSLLGHLPLAINAYVFFEKQVIPGEDYAEVWFTREQQAIKPFHSNIPSAPGYDPAQPLYDYHRMDWYTNARGASKTVWTDAFADEASGIAMVSATAPIQIDGELIGVAGVDVALTDMTARMAQIHPTEHSYVLLVGRNGVFIANSQWPGSVLKQTIGDLATELGSPDFARLGRAMTAQQQGLMEIRDPRSGQLAWAAYQPVLTTGWSVAIIIPQPDLLESVTTLGWRVASLAAIGLAGMALLLFIMSRSMVRPLGQLTQAARRMAAGDLAHRVNMARKDEIGALGQSFNAMAEALGARIAAEQEAQQQAQRLRQDEAAGRQQLEQTVASYLAFVQRVAQGDLSQRLPGREDGVLGQLGQGLNGMVESLQTMTRQIQIANENIAATAAEILAATTQQASSAAEQSAAISQTSITIAEIKSIAAQTARQANQGVQDSQTALQVAREGALAVEEMIGGMGQIRVQVEGIAQTILALADQTKAIGTIIGTVNELADQSNLLALNAAIEAARAGEQGKSFAVVAQHVRDLAERSKVATAQVREILGEIQRAANTAVLVTEEGTKGVEAGGRLATQTGQVIHRIAQEVEVGAQANTQIAAAAQQQTAGMEQINQAMDAIQQATTQALASTRQAERAAQDLHTLARTLQQTIAAYRL